MKAKEEKPFSTVNYHEAIDASDIEMLRKWEAHIGVMLRNSNQYGKVMSGRQEHFRLERKRVNAFIKKTLIQETQPYLKNL